MNEGRGGAAALERARAVADAVLYEGYLLYPYRRSSAKNRVRWQFGVLTPPAWIAAQGVHDEGIAGSAECWYQQCECLLAAPPSARLHVRVRFLQMQAKSVQRRSESGAFEPADSLEVSGVTHLSFDEAVPQEVDVVAGVEELRAGVRRPVELPGGEEVEPLVDARGRECGRLVRRRSPVRALVHASCDAVGDDGARSVLRVRVRTENTAPSHPATREEALREALIAAHCLLGVEEGSFASLLDPPAWARDAAKSCRNVHAFPVLAGEPGRDDTVLAAPIILYDHPQVAPESPGDLFDATEIDEILSLRTLTLTDEEKREARATDARAAAILDRVDTMPPEVMERLHGAVRSLRPLALDWSDVPEAASPRWVPAGDRVIRCGDRVVLRPKRCADVMDAALTGRVAMVESIEVDVDDRVHLAVVLDDDPGRDMGLLRHPAHRFFFGVDDVEPLGDSR